MTAAVRKATYDDVLAAPRGMIAEVIAGTLYTHPRPRTRHALVSTRLGGSLDGPFDRGEGGPGGWLFLDEPELHLGEDILVPDLAGWRTERMATLPDAAFLTLAPDWVCEVLSPSTMDVDRAEKLPIFHRERVGWVWLIDPEAKTLESYAREDDGWKLRATWRGPARVRAEPFAAIELDLARLWL